MGVVRAISLTTAKIHPYRCAVNNMSSSDVWPMFVNKHADLVATRFNRSVIAWDDAFNNGFDMDPRIVLMFWQVG